MNGNRELSTTVAGDPTIDRVLEGFLAAQRVRLSARTMGNYEAVIELLRDSLNGYAYTSLSEPEERQWRKAFDAGNEDAFTAVFGPEKIVEHYGEFLGYFMIRKVMAGEELLRAAGTVTKKLAAWLHEHGHIGDDECAVAGERGADAARDLPKAERLGTLLYEQAAKAPMFDPDGIDDEDWVEDYLMIERVEAGELWFQGGIGPLKLSKKATDLAQPGWSVNVVLARLGGRWHLVEVGNVYP